jgi:hypothetical protein
MATAVHLRPAFLFALGVTLTGVDVARVRQCPRCERFFFADHGRQAFCSSKCKGSAASQRFRARHRAALSEKAQKRYDKKMRAQYGANVQIKKRTKQQKRKEQ